MPQEFYSKQKSDRQPYEDRAKLISKLTIPYLIREDTDTGTTQMTTAQTQSYGGRLVNTLKAKMGMALLPPSTSSFRYVPDPIELEALTQGSPDNRAKVYEQISSATTRVNTELEVQQIRNSLFDLIAQLIVVGSVLIEKVKDKGILVHLLQSFVVELDRSGSPIQMCLVEKLKVLPDGVVVKEEKEEYDLYTMLTMDKDTKRWTMVQEIEGEYVGTEKTYKDYDSLPFRYLGWVWMQGDYCHRPYAEDYYADMKQMDELAELLTQGSKIAAKSLLFVNQRGGRTSKEDVAESDNGDIIDGVAEDVTVLQLDKNFDFQVPMEREARLQKGLASAFLMNESVTRDAERVTAKEIEFMARELETSSLAGIYSKLSLQWSKWIIQQIMGELKIKFNSIEVEVITGLDALGRSQENQKLDNYVQKLEATNRGVWLKDEEVVTRWASYDGINTVNLIKSPKEVQQEMKQRQQQAAQAAGQEEMAKATGQGAGQAMTQQQG